MFVFFAVKSELPLDSGAAAFHYVQDFVEGHLGGVAAGGLEEGAVGGAEVDAFFGGHAGKEAVGETGGKTVAAADPVFDFQIFEEAGFVEFAVVPEDGGPVVDEAGFNFAKGGADNFDIGVGLNDFLDHLLVGAGVESRQVFVSALDLLANVGPRGREVFVSKTISWKENAS